MILEEEIFQCDFYFLTRKETELKSRFQSIVRLLEAEKSGYK